MNHIIVRPLFALIALFAGTASAATCTYKAGAPQTVAAASMKVLDALMATAKVTACSITSTTRSPADQVRVMYDYIVAHSPKEARDLYGPEGDEVVDAYDAAKAASKDAAGIRAAMAMRLEKVLPAAVANRRLMHVERPGYDVLDIGISSIAPSDAVASLSAAAKAAEQNGSLHRFLGTDSNEKDALHFEFVR